MIGSAYVDALVLSLLSAPFWIGVGVVIGFWMATQEEEEWRV